MWIIFLKSIMARISRVDFRDKQLRVIGQIMLLLVVIMLKTAEFRKKLRKDRKRYRTERIFYFPHSCFPCTQMCIKIGPIYL